MKLKKSEKLRIELYRHLIDVFDINQEFNSLPHAIKQSFFNFTWPKIQVEKEENCNHAYSDFICAKVEEILSSNYFEINSKKIFLNQFHAVFAFYSHFRSINISSLNYLKSKSSDKKLQKIFEVSNLALKKLDKSLSSCQVRDYLDAVSFLTSQEVFKYFRIDEKSLYTKFILKKTMGKKLYPVILICDYEPKQKTLNLDKQIRVGYECSFFESGNVIPTVWKENTIDNESPLPVYIQDHAIKRVFERGTITGSENGYVHDSILRSLQNPVINGTDGPSYLVEYKYYSARMGYFLVSREKDCAIVRTFKFITMVGTPEFYMLKRALRATKEDLEYLGIDSLEILLNSDIYKDEKLMGVFKRCGLSELLNIGQKIKFESPKNAIAEDIKKYFVI